MSAPGRRLQQLAGPRRLRRLACYRGTVSVELALLLPLMLTLLTGAVETINYVLIHQKLERSSATLSDLVSQSVRMTEGLMRGCSSRSTR